MKWSVGRGRPAIAEEGAAIFGHLSDSFLGRKGALTAACALNASFSLLTAFSPSFSIYVSLRLLTGLSTGGVGLSAFVLATEPVGPSLRASVAMSTFYFSSLGAIAISLTSLLLPSWRRLYAAASIPSVLFLLFVIPFISESPRWHLVRRNLPAAMDVMRSIAKTNGSSIPDNVFLNIDSDKARQVSASIIHVLRSPATRPRIFFTILINLLGSVVYYGLTLNVGNLGTDMHFGVILNAVAEFPAYAATGIAVRWCGRRRMTAGTMAVSGLLCIAGGVLAGKGEMVKAGRLGCAAMGIFSAAAGFDVLYIYTTELFPTAVRNAALGCVTVAGQMGAMSAPMVVVAGGSLVPFFVFGVCGLVAGTFSWGLPETFNMPLYETMEELEGGEGLLEKLSSSPIV
ncbi:Organic cation/carnitine transporter 4 [Platanthera zijinensis]|uniref:H(+)/Pi cotransporter n=1 Tax=Platanthera zijinensis TaxID=2320716 RepID=A0AAP0BYJ1_9ASPA